MCKNDDRQLLLNRIRECIQLKREGTSWDFKKEWYEDNKKNDMLIDIICMANLADNVDGMIIIGVDEGNDYCVSGVENDPNRRKTQDLVCFLREKKFAGSIRPIVNYRSMNAMKQSVAEYIEYYNHDRAHSCLGYISPVKFEKKHVKNDNA